MFMHYLIQACFFLQIVFWEVEIILNAMCYDFSLNIEKVLYDDMVSGVTREAI